MLLRIVGALTAPTSSALMCRWRSRPQHHDRTHALQQNSVVIRSSRPRDGHRPFAEWDDMDFRRPGRAPRSLRLDAGRADHLAPLLGFVPDQLAEVSRRAREWRAAQTGNARLDLGIRERGVDFLVEPVDDLGWRGLGRGDSPPVTGLITRHE